MKRWPMTSRCGRCGERGARWHRRPRWAWSPHHVVTDTYRCPSCRAEQTSGVAEIVYVLVYA